MIGRSIPCLRIVAVTFILLIPAVTWAQSAIAGVVRDTSGAILPGVTVEAASPALIEKVRTATTDSEGNYRLLDLRPGVYTVTFSLPGFSTVRRDGIDLPAAFTAQVNGEMQVGAIEETITVSGAAPLVDVQNVTSQRLLPRELLDSIPASRSPQGFAALTPGITSQGISPIPGGVNEMQTALHGSAVLEALWLVDGMNPAGPTGIGGGSNTFRISNSYVSEINIVTGGNTAEQPFGGMVTSVIPKEGGNMFSGQFYAEYSDGNLKDDNLTDELRAMGFTKDSLTSFKRFWDVSPAVGGRLLRDKLWFFASYRDFGNILTRVGIFENLTPLGNVYTPDRTKPAVAKGTQMSRNLRLTWQATPRNKISLFADAAPQINWTRGSVLSSPEATQYTPYLPNAFLTATWKSPITNRWLLDAGASYIAVDYSQRRQTPETCSCIAPAVGFDVVSMTEGTTGTVWRASTSYGHYAGHMLESRGNASYVTGSHAVKAGVQLRQGVLWVTDEPNGARTYTLRNGLPSSLSQSASPSRYQNDTRAELGLFVQDQWTIRRLTLTGGARYDYFNAGHAAQHLPAGLWVPAREFPRTERSPEWNDFSPRIGASYDLFGDGRTAIKGSVGRFIGASSHVGQRGITGNNPVVRSVLQVTRSWADANGNFNPDCDLVSPLANGECGQISNLNFGQNNPNASIYADELLTGLRAYNWEHSLVAQRQLSRGVSVSVGYYHRSFSNFSSNDNTLVGPSDFSHYCITAPVDSRLPGGGGQQMCGLYDVSPALFGRSQIVTRDAAHYGEQRQIYDGVDVTENIRFANGITVSGGLNLGRTKLNTCFVVDSPQELRFCDVRPPFLPTVTFAGMVPLPWWGLMASATYRNFPGPEITASYLVANSQIAPSLGRNLSSGANGTVNVALIQPGTMYGERRQQLDMRVSKRLRVGRTRIMASVDWFNLINAAGADTINATYGPNWQRPTLLQLGRYVKLGGQVDF